LGDGGNRWAYVKGRVTTGRDESGLAPHQYEGSDVISMGGATPPGKTAAEAFRDSVEATALGWAAGFIDSAGVGILETLEASYEAGGMLPIGGRFNKYPLGLLQKSGVKDSLSGYSSETYVAAEALNPVQAQLGYAKGLIAGATVPVPGGGATGIRPAVVASRTATGARTVRTAASAANRAAVPPTNFANYGSEFLDDAFRWPSGEAGKCVAPGISKPPANAVGASGKNAAAREFLGVGGEFDAYSGRGGGINAQLGGDGFIDFVIQKADHTPDGATMFREMMAAYGTNAKGIRGTWFGTGTLTSNFRAYKRGIAAGLTPEASAAATFTGDMAREYGYSTVRIVEDTDIMVKVEFTR
jgi:hypothetical protein